MSRSKGNQTIKFGNLIEYSVRDIFSRNHAENEIPRLVPDLFFKKKEEKKALY